MYITRQLERKFLKMSGFFKAVLVTGARQVGKTTMLRHLAEEGRGYVSLDDTEMLVAARKDPRLFLMTHKPPVIIDEVQKAPELFPYIKLICDEADTPGLFWLTGSERYEMMSGIQESLAGRVCILNLYPLSFAEICGTAFDCPLDFSSECLTKRLSQAKPLDADDVFDYIWRGGMPYIQSADTETLSAYMSSYVSTYLLNDARNESGRINEGTLLTFLTACATNSGSVLNLNDIAKKTEISYPTAKNWLDILIKLNIVYLLHPYSSNKLKRLIKAPKLYFTDTGLCAHLAGWLTKETLQKGCEAGHYFENFVVSELMRDFSYSSQNYALTYYRDTNGKEVDLFLEADGKIFPLEIKLSASPTRREVKKYAVLDDNGIARGMGGIICMNPGVIPIDEHDNIIPVNVL